MTSINNSNWFTQGVNQVIHTSSIRPSSGSADASDLERQLEVMELISEIDRDFKCGHATDAAAARAKLNILISDPKYQKSLGTYLAFAQDAYKNSTNADTYIPWFDDPKTGANNIITWMSANTAAFDALFNSLPTDPFSQSFSQQQMDDIRNISLLMIDMIAVPNTAYGQGLDALFFKGDGIGLNLPNMLLAYYYQQNVSSGDPHAYQDAIAQLKNLKATFPAKDPLSGQTTPNYDHMLDQFDALVNNPPTEAEFKQYVFDYFAMVAQHEHSFIG